MIVGSGLISSGFENVNLNNYIIFASGVSDSNEIDYFKFKREKDLLIYYLENFKNKTLVYFNSIVALNNIDTPYFNHKNELINLIKTYDNYKIYNVPQVFGKNGNKNNLVNYFVHCLKNKQRIFIQKETYRSIIDINDLKNIVLKTLKTEYKILNLAYIEILTALEILEIISDVYNITPIFTEIESGYSICSENDEIINEVLEELNIEKHNYTKLVIEKYGNFKN